MLPRMSNTPAERSPASRTIEVKLVRINAAACSLTTEIKRFHITSSWIASRRRRGSAIIVFVQPKRSGATFIVAPHSDHQTQVPAVGDPATGLAIGDAALGL